MARAERELVTQVTARAKFIRMSPYKVREVAVLIRGKQIDEARRILAFTPKAASREISKVLESAIANAEHNFQIPQEELAVKIATADEGTTIKRFRPRAQGRGFRIRKRTCHINLVLERAEPKLRPAAEPRRRRKPEGEGKATAAAPAAGTTTEKPKKRSPKTNEAAAKTSKPAAKASKPAAKASKAEAEVSAPSESAASEQAQPTEGSGEN